LKKRKEKKEKKKKKKRKKKNKKKEKKKKKRKKRKEKKKRKKRRKKKEKRRVPRRLYPPGIESRNTTPHTINGLVEVKKASFPPFSTAPCVLAHTGSRARNNGCARVACVQSLTCASANIQESACIIQSNGLGKQAAKGAGQHAGNERCKSWCLVDGAAGRKKGTWGGERA
jgi:signal recognition particle GTPase